MVTGRATGPNNRGNVIRIPVWQKDIYLLQCVRNGSRDSVVCIGTRYGLDGPGFGLRCGQSFPHPTRPAPRPTHPPIKWVKGVIPEGKAARA